MIDPNMSDDELSKLLESAKLMKAARVEAKLATHINAIRVLLSDGACDRAAVLRGLGLSPGREKKAGDMRIRQSRGKVLPPLYREPITGTTWSGFGRRPAWVKDGNGEPRADLRIDRDSAASIPP